MPRNLTAEQRAARIAAVQAGREAGETMETIAARLNMRTKSLEEWWRQSNGVAPKTRRKQSIATSTTQRPCMCCRAPFESDGPHNRLCTTCNGRSHMLTPYTPDPGGDTGRRRQARSPKA